MGKRKQKSSSSSWKEKQRLCDKDAVYLIVSIFLSIGALLAAAVTVGALLQ